MADGMQAYDFSWTARRVSPVFFFCRIAQVLTGALFRSTPRITRLSEGIRQSTRWADWNHRAHGEFAACPGVSASACCSKELNIWRTESQMCRTRSQRSANLGTKAYAFSTWCLTWASTDGEAAQGAPVRLDANRRLQWQRTQRACGRCSRSFVAMGTGSRVLWP